MLDAPSEHIGVALAIVILLISLKAISNINSSAVEFILPYVIIAIILVFLVPPGIKYLDFR
jgi:hypothetical protein